MALLQWGAAVLTVGLASFWAVFLLARLFPALPGSLFWPLTFGVSVGGFTLLLAVLGFVGLNAGVVVLLLVVLWTGSAAVGVRRALPRVVWRDGAARLARLDPAAWAMTGIGVILLLVLAQASYYPFIGDDEISRYAWFAREIAQPRLPAQDSRAGLWDGVRNAGLTPQVRGYPMLLPLAYAATFFTSGGLPEQAAKLFPVLYAGLTVAATFALARRWFGRMAAIVAALVLTATPLYIVWAPVGYLDIPSALYFVLAAYALDVWRERRTARWAVVAGTLIGLALWTKQSGFTVLPVAGVMVAITLLTDFRHGLPTRATQAARHGLLILIAMFAAGGWWYVRNALYDGLGQAVPGPGPYYTQQANNSLAFIIPFVGYLTDFGYLSGLLYFLGLVGGIVILWQRAGRAAKVAWCLFWSVPYTLLWWQLFSYDPRFLLTVLPFYAVLSGASIICVWRSSAIQLRWRNSPISNLQSPISVAVVLLIVVMGIVQARPGGALQWLLAPTASYAERLERAKGDMYPVVVYLRDHIGTSDRIYSMDPRLSYYLIDRSIRFGYPFYSSDLRDYDYVVVGSWAETVYAGLNADYAQLRADFDNPGLFEQVFAGPDSSIVVYRVLGS